MGNVITPVRYEIESPPVDNVLISKRKKQQPRDNSISSRP